MSIEAYNWWMQQSHLPPAERVVLGVLCHHHNGRTGRCDPAQSTVAESAGMVERTVRRHIKSLEHQGLLSRKKRGGHGEGRMSDFFELHFDFTGKTDEGNRTIRANSEADGLPDNSCTSDEGLPDNFGGATGQFGGGLPDTALSGKQEGTGKEQEYSPCSPPVETTFADTAQPGLPFAPLPAEKVTLRDALTAPLTAFASVEAASSYVAYRHRLGKPLSEAGAKRTAEQLRQIAERGGDPDDALALIEKHGLAGLKADWYFEAKAGAPTGTSLAVIDHGTGPAPDPVVQAVDAYNAKAAEHGWSRCQNLTPGRRRKINARLRECDGIEGWHYALSEVEKSEFLMGRVSGRDGTAFKMRIDFMAQPESFARIMEGVYDRGSAKGHAQPTSTAARDAGDIRRVLERRHGGAV